MAHASFGRLDFSRITGRLNPAQHGSNTPAPYAHRWFFNVDEELKSLHFSYSRTHDWALINPGQRIIDTHFIFPLMHLDPKDPKNYYFRATDAAIRITQDLGTKIFYRLGTSIEQNSDQAPEHNNTLVPEDFDQYAEVLAGIVRHYTRGWADGFRYDMKYWEIWNEPELGTQTWCGTKEEFVRFFVTIFKRLKSEFPELKIGGPAFTTPTGEWQTAFLDGCKAAGIVPDFYSYHCYTSDPEKLIQRPDVGRALLDSYGFTKTEIVINEWHFRQDWTGVIPDSQPDLVRFSLNGPMGHNNIQSAVFNLAVLMGWQEKPLDIGCYYGCGIDGAFAFRDRDHRWNKCFYSMQMFGEIVSSYADRVAWTPAPQPYKHVYALGAFSADRKRAAVLIADYGGRDAGVLPFEVAGLENYRIVEARQLDNEKDLLPCEIQRNGDRICVSKKDPGSAAWLIEFEAK